MKQYRLIIFDWQDTLMQVNGKLFPDVVEVLTELKNRGYLLAVATNASRKTLEQFFHQTKVAHLFNASRCADETALKPDPLMLIEIVEELTVDASNAVMIGDSEADIHMAKNAGIDAIKVDHYVEKFNRLLERFS